MYKAPRSSSERVRTAAPRTIAVWLPGIVTDDPGHLVPGPGTDGRCPERPAGSGLGGFETRLSGVSALIVAARPALKH